MLPFRRGAAWQTLFLLCALAYCINEASSEGRVVCYYTNWSVYRPGTAKFNPQNINPYLCTHLVYAFGGFTKDNQMKPFDKYQDIEQGGYAKFTGLKTYNKQLKTMIAIGGWNEASSRFSPLVASNERRQQFIKNILKFLRQNHFDGIDLDWEYPAHREGGKSRDRDNYAQFVQELRAEFEREAEKTGRTRLLLTMAVPAGIEYIDKGYDVPKLNKYLDWFNVLTYDFHSSHEPSVNHHAPLYSLEEDSEYNYDAELNIDYSIKYYLKAGADRDKLVLGIPTYGRSYTLINEESTELGAPSEGPGEQGDATREKGYLAYYEICQTLKDDPEWTVVQPNANVMGPYAYRRNQWVGYDDEAIVRKKAEYVVAQGLGGIMFWAIDNDDFRGTCNGKPYPLIEAAKEAMVEALGLGINEVAKPSGPQKPSRSRSRDNASTRNRLNGKTEAPSGTRRPSATRRPALSSSTQAPPPSTTFKLTEAEGSSLYIGGRASTTPPPPTTPDPGSDFKCEEEGFFQHPRDCKKYYWCLDSGPSGLGIVAHMFTCPSGLYFNPAADSCDFARNVPCKTKKSTTVAPVTSTTTTTTTARSNRVTAAPTARPVYPRTTSSTTTSTTTTTTTTPASVEEDLEYEEDTDELSPSKSTDAEEDPQVIKELIDLIRKVGGVEQLEKHLLRNKDGSITLKENSASGAATTPSTISKSLYDRVLSRPGTLSSFTRNRFKISEATGTSTEASSSSSTSSGASNSYSKYSSVLRGNSRQGPQNEGIEKLAEFDGFLKERKQYVTINRHRSANQGDDEGEHADQQEEEENLAEVETTTRRPLSSATPSYTSLRRTRPTTVAPPAEESHEEAGAEQQTQTQVKSYATLSRTRGRTTASPEVTEAAPSSTTNRYKYFERTRPTKSATADDAEDPTEDEEEEYDDEQKDIVTVQSKQSTNTRKYASIGRRTTTTTTATPETTTTAGTETAKASTTTTTNNNSHYNSSNNNNNVKLNNLIPTEENTTATPSTTAQSETTTTTTTTTNETTEPNESTSTTTSTTNNLHTTTTPTPIVASTVPTTTANGISSDSLLATELSEASPTHLPSNPDLETTTPTTTTTTTTEPELATTTTPRTTSTTGNNELNDVNNVDEDSEVTKTKTQYKYATTNRRRITTTTTTTANNNSNNNNNAEAANDASPTNGLSSFNSIRTNPGRRQPQKDTTQTTTTEPNLSSPRPFGYPRRRTRPTASTTTTTPQTDNDNNTDNNDNETDAVAQVVKKTRLSPGDRPKNRYQLSRTRGSTTNTTPTTRTTTTQQQPPITTTTARRVAFGGRQRAQVTKLTLVDEQTEETETKGDAHDDVEEEEKEDEEESTATSTTTTTTSRPTPKRIRVLKFRRPLNSNSNSTTVDSTTNSATDTNPDTTTATPTTISQSTTSNTTSTTGNKRFRKIVRKLRPVDSSTAASVDNSDETTRKPFVPSHTRFTDQDNDLVNLRQRIKDQQARGEPQDGVISNRFKTLGQKDDQDVSELQKLRDKVKAEQAKGDGDQGVINDRLKKLLAEKSTSSGSRQKEDSSSADEETSSVVSSQRPFFKRKLVARRPYTPPSASGGGTTKAPLTFSTTRPTAKFVRKKNGRFDPFNSSVRNRGEGFVRSDPRGSRLPGADRFRTQENNDEDDEEEVEERHEQPLQNQFGTTLRRPFVPKTRPVLDKSKPQQEDDAEESDDEEDEEEDSEEDSDEDEDEDEEVAKPAGGEGKPQEPKVNPLYRPKDNRVLPGSRPSFAATASGAIPPTASGNVPFNPRNRPSSSANTNGPPAGRFGTTKRPRVVNRPPGVASPNLTLKPVASDYERTTPLTPLKPAPFIPSNNRSYERKYTGPSTEATETASENSLIEDLNIDALNARNKKIFDKHSKKHPALKPKVVKVESETGTEAESGTEVAVDEETTEQQQQLEQGFVTTPTPSTTPPPPAPPSTQLDTATTTDTTPPETVTEIETETETETVTETETATNANEATSINSQDQTISSTTQAPPPATTLLHVFTLLEGEGQDEEPTTRRPTVRVPPPTIQTEVVPKHKVIEINRIVEINSKQAKAAQRKSKANQDFGTLRVESLPHVEQLGEISVVKFVHLVDGSDIQINDGHSTVADYTPTEPTSHEQSAASPPVRNSLPEAEGSDTTDRSGKSLLPEVLTGALETSTISLEGLFDSARKGKQLNSNSIFAETEESSTTVSSPSSSATETATSETTTPAPTYVRPIVPLLRPESNESSPLVISIANLDQVILSKVQKSLAEGSQTTVAPDVVSDSNSAFSVRQPLVVQAPIGSGAQETNTLNTQDQTISGNNDANIEPVAQATTTTRPEDDQVAEETTVFSTETTTESQPNTQTKTPTKTETLTAMPIGAVIMGQLGLSTQTTTTTADNTNQQNTRITTTISSGAISSEAFGGNTQTATTAENNNQENRQQTSSITTTTSEISSGAISSKAIGVNNNNLNTQTTVTSNNSPENTQSTTTIDNQQLLSSGAISGGIGGNTNLNTQTTTTNTTTTTVGSKVSEAVSFSSETHVVHRKKMGRKGRGRRLRNRKTTTTTTTTTTTETPTTAEATFDDTTTVVPE
ncbi:mucin-2 isoform X1 [Drosophila ficusphila]|uniref:mucin-2 isoform X1 n=1 Tax=Drosophila ficusphila TaxID=30025 RepID=UPI0007E62C78|nr:mucin-2 isoform X1 [Drosophila ficusphila]XP_017055531.1 mucin-2 isoform X1 [Drosophila ficusphila]XP_017055532.1 mucin-2 isoform X1 [Drosophila ficusphila]